MTARKKSATLWTIQGLLAALFLFAGITKFLLPPEILQQGPIALPLGFLRFIGAAEIAGAIGLVLPGIFHIRQYLTAFAAVGLVLVMTGATVLNLHYGTVGPALIPFVVGLLSATVAYGRRGWTALD
jgi:uncharacterized membrane protein